jgi:hypothetical protein
MTTVLPIGYVTLLQAAELPQACTRESQTYRSRSVIPKPRKTEPDSPTYLFQVILTLFRNPPESTLQFLT